MDDKEFWQRVFLIAWPIECELTTTRMADSALQAMKARWPDAEPQKAGKRSKTAASEDFEAFWQAYPSQRRVSKGSALRAWKNVKPPLDRCLETLAWQKNDEGWTKENGKFIPHPATWLNGSRWLDERPGGQKGNGAVDLGNDWLKG